VEERKNPPNMASSRMPARRRVLTGRRVFVTLVAATGVVLTPLTALAVPETPGTAQEAAALVAAKSAELDLVTEQFNDARVQLEAQQVAADEAARGVEAADAAVAEARDKVRQVARSAYTGDQLSTLQAMLTSDSAGELLDQIGTLDTIAQYNNGILGVAQDATEAAAETKAAADAAAADAKAQLDRVTAQQAELESQVAAFEAARARLSAEEQRRAAELAEQQRAAAAAPAVDRAAPAASRSTTRQPTPPVAPGPVAAASGAAQAAVNTALAQVGDPYVWAASGPNAFDCSGLTQFAFSAAGVKLPHSSRAQSGMGTSVPLSALQPGDLLFFYSPVSHVAMYIGNGQMVHASTSGQPVKIASINAMGSQPFARRIAG
jgi:cell wall-associated NlpC family hydrolase